MCVLHFYGLFHVFVIYFSEIRGKGGQRRGSLFDIIRSLGNDNREIDLEKICEDSVATSSTNTNPTLQGPPNTGQKTSRSDSVITPGLIKNLKKNKKRIVAKGLLFGMSVVCKVNSKACKKLMTISSICAISKHFLFHKFFLLNIYNELTFIVSRNLFFII